MRAPYGALLRMKRIHIIVVPRTSTNEVSGVMSDGALKVRLMSPPVDGRANEALCALLAEHFGVKKYAVRVVQGHMSKRKVVEIDGLS